MVVPRAILKRTPSLPISATVIGSILVSHVVSGIATHIAPVSVPAIGIDVSIRITAVVMAARFLISAVVARLIRATVIV